MVDYGLGFDTGGTYTDAVIIDLSSNKIVCSAKSLTTRNDLSLGIAGAISTFDRNLMKDVRMVSLSSTLATNSIVEGKGCRVGLIAAGREFDHSIPVDEYICISGGHDLSGKEKDTLDEQSARDFMRSVKGKIDGLAITCYLSVRNPSHENRLAEIAKEELDIPIVCGHQLSSSLGFNERTVTCVMNARLIPIIKRFRGLLFRAGRSWHQVLHRLRWQCACLGSKRFHGNSLCPLGGSMLESTDTQTHHPCHHHLGRTESGPRYRAADL